MMGVADTIFGAVCDLFFPLSFDEDSLYPNLLDDLVVLELFVFGTGDFDAFRSMPETVFLTPIVLDVRTEPTLFVLGIGRIVLVSFLIDPDIDDNLGVFTVSLLDVYVFIVSFFGVVPCVFEVVLVIRLLGDTNNSTCALEAFLFSGNFPYRLSRNSSMLYIISGTMGFVKSNGDLYPLDAFSSGR